MFANPGGANIIAPDESYLMWKALERSNVNAADEIVAMITSQRGLQSASQVLRMYDLIMNKAANDIGRV
jgi:flagellar basal-body rod protein FlgG